jgi:NAD(P)-dependent dehydrogenase (short-subunit alcohol dehydrogenase family)
MKRWGAHLVNPEVDYWVTGSNGHIGNYLTRELIGRGFSVLGLDQPGQSPNLIDGYSFVPVDLSKTSEVEMILRGLPSPRKGYVHLAALTGPIVTDGWGGPLEDQSLEIWEEAFSVNVTSAFLFSKEAVTRSIKSNPRAKNSLSIVFASSIYGTLGPNPSLYKDNEMRNPAAYGASKAALESLARYISSSTGGVVRANSVAAGGIERLQSPTFISEYASRTPIGRMATEEDILRVIMFLLGEDSRYIFGQTLFADGGFTLW